MSLSVCSNCKQFAEGVCLLGQNYVEIFKSLHQNQVDDVTEIVENLPSCSFWEASEITHQASRTITLNYYAWRKLANMKLHGADCEYFRDLVDAARAVIAKSMIAETEPPKDDGVLSSLPSEPSGDIEEDKTTSSRDVIDHLEQPEAEAVLASQNGHSATSQDKQAQAVKAHFNNRSSATLDIHTGQVLQFPDITATSRNEASSSDPIEVAIRDLWKMATDSPNGTFERSLLGGRGTGRIG